MNRMQSGIALFAAAPVHIRNTDVDHEYRQDSDFYYLTGFEEPGAICLLAPGNTKHEFLLFVRPRDKENEQWAGLRAGVEGVILKYGAEMAHPVDKISEILPEFLENASCLYYQLNKNAQLDQTILSLCDAIRPKYRWGIYPPSQIIDPTRILADMRVIKTSDELTVLRKAVEISCRAHSAAMKAARPGKTEYQIQAIIEYVFRSRGSSRNGYPSIVGSGPNACILHYTENRRTLADGDLLLVDAGAEFEYYTGDITRTYPVSGKFTPPQRAVYDIVLHTQKKVIDAVAPGITYNELHSLTVREITQGLIDLNVLTGSVDENIENDNYKKYFMHRTGHWLGLDVHDPGKYFNGHESRVLEPGMVLTIEPGLYFHEDCPVEDLKYIGVRIEDDILVSKSGPEILSAACPKEVHDLEAIIGMHPAPEF